MELNDVLLKDERVIMTYTKKIKIFNKVFFILSFINLYFGFMGVILFIFGILSNSPFYFYSGILWIIFGIGLTGIITYIVSIIIKNKLSITKKDFKAYQETFYFTNRRFILKTYRIFFIRLLNFPYHEIKNDYFILNHENIKSILVSVSTFRNMRTIYLSEKPAKRSINWDLFIKIKIPSDKFKKFFEILNEYLILHIVDNPIKTITQYNILTEDR